MHRQALGLKEKALGKKHPDTLTSMNNLAKVRVWFFLDVHVALHSILQPVMIESHFY
jgi:hypothetical protein